MVWKQHPDQKQHNQCPRISLALPSGHRHPALQIPFVWFCTWYQWDHRACALFRLASLPNVCLRDSFDADPGPRDLCVVAAMDKFTRTTEILWRKRDSMATLYVRERARGPESQPLPGQAFIAFLGTLYPGWSSFIMHRFTVGDYLLQTTKKRMLLIISKRRMLQIKGESDWTGYTPYLGGLAQILGS